MQKDVQHLLVIVVLMLIFLIVIIFLIENQSYQVLNWYNNITISAVIAATRREFTRRDCDIRQGEDLNKIVESG